MSDEHEWKEYEEMPDVVPTHTRDGEQYFMACVHPDEPRFSILQDKTLDSIEILEGIDL